MLTRCMMRDFMSTIIDKDVRYRYSRISHSEKNIITNDAIQYYFKENEMYAHKFTLDIYDISSFISTFLNSNNLRETEDGIFLDTEDFESVESFERLFLSVVALPDNPDESCTFLTSFNDDTNLHILARLDTLLSNNKDDEVLLGLIPSIENDLETLIKLLSTCGKNQSYIDDWTCIYSKYLSIFKDSTSLAECM